MDRSALVFVLCTLLLASAELGSTCGVGLELDQPLEGGQRFFGELQADPQRSRIDFFQRERRVSEYTLETGQEEPRLQQDHRGGAWVLGLDMDRLDKLHFPRRGWCTQASWLCSPAAVIRVRRSTCARACPGSSRCWPSVCRGWVHPKASCRCMKRRGWGVSEHDGFCQRPTAGRRSVVRP